MYRIPAAPAHIQAEPSPHATLTRADVEACPWTMKEVRYQAECIRRELATDGESWFCGAGSHRTKATHRNFALRVLVAKGECTKDPSDMRRHVATGRA